MMPSQNGPEWTTLFSFPCFSLVISTQGICIRFILQPLLMLVIRSRTQVERKTSKQKKGSTWHHFLKTSNSSCSFMTCLCWSNSGLLWKQSALTFLPTLSWAGPGNLPAILPGSFSFGSAAWVSYCSACPSSGGKRRAQSAAAIHSRTSWKMSYSNSLTAHQP